VNSPERDRYLTAPQFTVLRYLENCARVGMLPSLQQIQKACRIKSSARRQVARRLISLTRKNWITSLVGGRRMLVLWILRSSTEATLYNRECEFCGAPATTLDKDGDPTCALHESDDACEKNALLAHKEL
jgi:hypothetical protein